MPQLHTKNRQLWEYNLQGAMYGKSCPIDNIQSRLEESLTSGAKHYVPEQTLLIGLFERPGNLNGAVNKNNVDGSKDSTQPEMKILPTFWQFPVVMTQVYIFPGNDAHWALNSATCLAKEQVKTIERSINLTVNR
jgi:adenylate cyclase